LIDERSLAVIDVGDDCDITDFIHEDGTLESEGRRMWSRLSLPSNKRRS
jgi:hypothetical protein